MAAISAKQELFAQAVATGMFQSDAYRQSYDTKAQNHVIHIAACKLMAKPLIAERVAELRAGLAKKQLWTRELSVKALIQAFKDGTPAVKISAVRELNLMHGFNAPIDITLTKKALPTSIDEFIIPGG